MLFSKKKFHKVFCSCFFFFDFIWSCIVSNKESQVQMLILFVLCTVWAVGKCFLWNPGGNICYLTDLNILQRQFLILLNPFLCNMFKSSQVKRAHCHVYCEKYSWNEILFLLDQNWENIGQNIKAKFSATPAVSVCRSNTLALTDIFQQLLENKHKLNLFTHHSPDRKKCCRLKVYKPL